MSVETVNAVADVVFALVAGVAATCVLAALAPETTTRANSREQANCVQIAGVLVFFMVLWERLS